MANEASTAGQLPGLRDRLMLWFGGLSLAAMLSVGIYASQMVMTRTADQAGEALHTSAMAAAELLGANLRERELEIALLSQAPHFVAGNLEHPHVLQSMERRVRLRDEFAWMGVTDAEGRVVQSVDGLLVGADVAQRPWFIAGLKGVHAGDVHEAVLLAKLLPAQASGEPLRFIDFAAPIIGGNGQVIGVLGAHAHWSWVTRTVEVVARRHAADRDIEILVASGDGTILYPEPGRTPDRLPASMQSDKAFATVRWDGDDFLASRVAVHSGTANELGWQIVVRQPLATALAPVHALRDRMLLLGFLAVALITFVASRLAHRISRPIERLAAVARDIEAHRSMPAPSRNAGLREVAQLEGAMQSMTHTLLARETQLESMNHTLEQQVMERTEALAESNRQLAQLAAQDALTGLRNRRSFDERLTQCVQVAARTGRGFSLLLIDADHFKRVNDQFGHPVGDAVLRQLAGILRDTTRVTDFVARFGGEEFAVLLPETPAAAAAHAVAEKIRVAVEGTNFPDVGRITVSIGCHSWDGEQDRGGAKAIRQADAALYAAKAAGRNRVVSAPPLPIG